MKNTKAAIAATAMMTPNAIPAFAPPDIPPLEDEEAADLLVDDGAEDVETTGVDPLLILDVAAADGEEVSEVVLAAADFLDVGVALATAVVLVSLFCFVSEVCLAEAAAAACWDEDAAAADAALALEDELCAAC